MKNKVITKTCNRYAGNDKTTIDNTLVEAVRGLKPYDVVIPFADELIKYIPSTLLMRTYTSRLLDYIASSTVLHQYQRDKTEDDKLIATWDDYEYGRVAFLKTITNDAMASLSPQQQRLLDVILNSKEPIVVADIHKNISKSRDWIYRNLEVLKEYGLIEQGSMWKQSANKDVRTYVGRLGVFFGCNLPPTDSNLGFLGCRKNIRIQGNDGDTRLYDVYYNNTNNTIKPKEKHI